MSVINVTGVNDGPAESLPATPQSPIGNIWKNGVFSVSLSPSSVAANTAAEQTFAATGIGLETGDFVYVNKAAAQAGLGIVGARVSATDTLAITFGNFSTAVITPTSAEAYKVFVARPQPNWTAPSSGNQLNW